MSESNRIFDFITPFINQVQLIENMLTDVRTKRLLLIATGQQLDDIGTIVDQRRGGLNDSDYRDAIFRKIFFNLSCGQPDVLIQYIELITGDLEYTEPNIATAHIVIHTLPTPLSLLLPAKTIKPAGVSLEIVYTDDNDFAFNTGDEGSFTSEGFGFLEDSYPEIPNGYTAGKLVESITVY